ncbi:FAD dependent oxidoreductase [Laetiporus sulphureus 93-53]|uniref:FAD dependent oxidoreductase n=1 Tax=Laetiporus sulphureus 93-53 TaxID=1314785 RepID=A0A165EJD6_9APHY|nr:FAD dependent oxidoreductase [Laetiporus sulphureus 93-53]KZT07172.1 FAD dependent oxidoreductase [Laetiporus sulphureus 93-53]
MFLSLLLLSLVQFTMPAIPVPLYVWADHQVNLRLPTAHGPAPLPVPNSTKSFWIDSPGANPLAGEGSEGPLTEQADVCIIGSGITGVSAAYHLGNALVAAGVTEPVKVVILEARDFCSGATGRNGGHLTPAVFSGFKQLAASFGTDDALRAFALEHHTASSILQIIKDHTLESAVDLVEGGHVDLMFSPEEVADVQADYDAAKLAGIDLSNVEWMDKAEVESRYGSSYPGVHIPGHNLWPLKFITQLYKLAAASPSLALTLHTRTPVTRITRSASPARRWDLATARGTLACSYILHATNGYASHLLPHLHGPTGIVPTRGQIIATRANVITASLSRSSFSANEGLEYWFPRPVPTPEEHPLVILGGAREATLPAYEFYVADDSVVNPRVGEALRKFLPRVFPGKYEEGREPEMEWTGIMGYTASGDPFVGRVADPAMPGSAETFKGQYISAGYTGHGMPRAFACAEAVAQMIAADITKHTWSLPTWLPKHYVTAA